MLIDQTDLKVMVICSQRHMGFFRRKGTKLWNTMISEKTEKKYDAKGETSISTELSWLTNV